MNIFANLFKKRSPLEKYKDLIQETNSYSAEIKSFTEDQIKNEISEIRKYFSEFFESLQGDEFEKKQEFSKTLFKKAPRVFALTREAASRTIGQFHYEVQLAGGFALAENRIAEMKTGEGKTLTATLPLVLYALAGKGAHLVTVNDYLARWQASQMGKIFHYLGLTTSSIQHEASFFYDPAYQPEDAEIAELEKQTQGLVMDVKHMRPISRKEAYSADITYGTNNEFGFDYLRDNMAQHFSQMSQRDLFFAIVDEVDSILIDEARTPLIISAPDAEPTQKYYDFAKLVEHLEETKHFVIDEKHKSVNLTDDGIGKIEELLKVPNIYDTSKGVATIHHIEQALRAKTLYKKDRDYVAKEGEIVIVDEFTGRMMFGRRYSQGLHQAIEAKEGVKIQAESKTLATITFQNLFRLYAYLSGMTGTALTEEEEFFKIYKLQVEVIPTNKPLVRKDGSDLVYKTEKAKFQAIAQEVKQRYQNRQPVLLGTVSIAKNEILAEFLKKTGVPFETLNAKNHEREAQIIAQAGRPGAVTLATNIAGRGVDILLGGNPVDPDEAEIVRKAGGLHVIGSERHESRRIDNQLRGRSGRQGDPGSTQFFVSMEDDLMRLFGGDRMKKMMDVFNMPEDQPIEAGMVSKSIEQAQKKIEGLNFDTRKHVLEFDDVLNHQRNVIYKRRRKYLPGVELKAGDENALKQEFLSILREEIDALVKMYFLSSENPNASDLAKQAAAIFPIPENLRKNIEQAMENAADSEFASADAIYKSAVEAFEKKEKEMGASVFDGAMRFVALQSLDELWMEHLDTMDHLRDSVRLRGYGQRDPLVEYKKEGFSMFQRMIAEINKQMVYTIFKINVQPRAEEPQPIKMVTNEQVSKSGKQIISKSESPGRNDPCPCGSGKKYKKCHGK